MEPGLSLVAGVHPRAAGVLLDAQVVNGAVLGRRRQTNLDLGGRVHDAIFQHLERGKILFTAKLKRIWTSANFDIQIDFDCEKNDFLLI